MSTMTPLDKLGNLFLFPENTFAGIIDPIKDCFPRRSRRVTNSRADAYNRRVQSGRQALRTERRHRARLRERRQNVVPNSPESPSSSSDEALFVRTFNEPSSSPTRSVRRNRRHRGRRNGTPVNKISE